MAGQKNYYEILGLDSNANGEQIRAAFRRLARERHPDRFQGAARSEAEVEFQDITEAYNALSDPSRRSRYDQAVANPAPDLSKPKDVAKAFLARAVMLLKSGDPRRAGECFSQAIAHDQTNARARQLFALFLAQHQNRLEEALRQIDQAARLEPLNSKILLDASKLFAQARMFARATRFAEQAAQIEPGDATVESWLEQLRAVRGDGSR